MEWHFRAVEVLKIIFYFTYITIFFNLISSQEGDMYLDLLDDAIKALIGIIIVYYYNPYKKIKKNIPRGILFEAGILLILSSSLKTISKSIPIVKQFI